MKNVLETREKLMLNRKATVIEQRFIKDKRLGDNKKQIKLNKEASRINRLNNLFNNKKESTTRKRLVTITESAFYLPPSTPCPLPLSTGGFRVIPFTLVILWYSIFCQRGARAKDDWDVCEERKEHKGAEREVCLCVHQGQAPWDGDQGRQG